MILKNVKFIKSAAKPADFLESGLPQIAIVGRSNVGKSSFINFLCNNKNMARVSKEAGRTRLVNYFEAEVNFAGEESAEEKNLTETVKNSAEKKADGKRFMFVDLPGYGFSEAGKAVKDNWAPLIDTYLTTEKNLIRIFMLVDIRHEPTELDALMVDFMVRQNLPFSIIATKADKIGKTRIYEHTGKIAAVLKVGRDNIIAVSNTEKTGGEKIAALIGHIISQE